MEYAQLDDAQRTVTLSLGDDILWWVYFDQSAEAAAWSLPSPPPTACRGSTRRPDSLRLAA